MTVVLTALAPVVLLIALGYGLRRSGLAPDASWSAVERLTYFVLFPALLVSRVSAQGVPTGLGSAAAVTVMTVLAVAALLLALRPAFRRLSGPAYTALFQGGVRFNTYLSFAMAEGLLGAEALAPLAWLAAVMILMINVLCVLAFARWGQGRPAHSRRRGKGPGHQSSNSRLPGWGCAGGPAPGLAQRRGRCPRVARKCSPAPGALGRGGGALAPRKATELQPLVASSVVQFTVKPAWPSALQRPWPYPRRCRGCCSCCFACHGHLSLHPGPAARGRWARYSGGDHGPDGAGPWVTPLLLATFLAV